MPKFISKYNASRLHLVPYHQRRAPTAVLPTYGGGVNGAGRDGIDGVDGVDGVDGTSAEWTSLQNVTFSQTILAGVRTAIDLSGQSLVVSRIAAPRDAHDFFAGGLFRPLGDAVGEKYRLRISFAAANLVINNVVRFELDIGGGVGVVDTQTVPSFDDAGDPYMLSVNFDIYAYDTFFANGGTLYATANTEVDLTDLVTLVTIEVL